ncbi:MAG: GNAT family N-acetyltransferase [Planctomycetota bacterium]|nr:GNAT family N-acetyltransferase [Planctomycetota bacterium]
MRAVVSDGIAEFDARDWNGLVGDHYPFLRHEFLLASEKTGCVSPDTGWSPRHIGLFDDKNTLLGAMPLYEKTHSWGEFVFDWSWAQAYRQAGLDYYPKLISAAPFTPAHSGRLFASEPELKTVLVQAALAYADKSDQSSLHVLFPREDELGICEEVGLKVRKDCQFHWHNHDYRSFDDFLATFSSKKRKKARRDRRHVSEAGIRFRWLTGHELDSAIWADVYQLISLTFLRRGSMPYFSFDFFVEVSRRMPENILVVLAEENRQPTAAAVFYVSHDVLYGRYWGSDSQFNALHFETCYYQGIDFCIANDKKVFEPGTQGEHKISRGFTPVSTWSAHWLARPEFFAAVAKYLDAEEQHIDRYIEAVDAHSPYRNLEAD